GPALSQTESLYEAPYDLVRQLAESEKILVPLITPLSNEANAPNAH
ncbi:hypothetical protein D036_2115, partial [Vibrio parahaemolyticus VP232]